MYLFVDTCATSDIYTGFDQALSLRSNSLVKPPQVLPTTLCCTTASTDCTSLGPMPFTT